MKIKNLGGLFLLFVFVSLVMGADQARQKQADDIREAVFRWQFDHNASARNKKTTIYFLSLGDKGTDPSDEFMKRFTDHKPAVRKRSQCISDAGKGVQDKLTGEPGLILMVMGIKWISDTEVEVEGGYYAAGLSASGNTYTVKKEGGKWAVTKDKMNWIA